MNKPIEFRADRHPAESYEDILNRDTREVPEKLREQEVRDMAAQLRSLERQRAELQAQIQELLPRASSLPPATPPIA